MVEYRNSVVKAAEYLDGYAEKGTFSWLTTDWRDKIDLDTLSMVSCNSCILGQLHPNGYDGAVGDLCKVNNASWYGVDGAFSTFTSDWKEYIKGTRSGLRVDSVWSHSFGRDVTVKALIEIDNAKHVVYAVNESGAIWVMGETDFLDGRTEIVKLDLKKGDQVTFKSYTGNAMFYWCSDDLVIRVEGSEIGHSSLEYYATCYGTASRGDRSQAVRFEKIANA